MAYRIIEVDGIQIDPSTGRFPVETLASPHALNGDQHTGTLDDNQIPQNIMRDSEHQSDPHNMTIDGRDVSADGSKLDGIESGAEVNNLTDQQANSLVGGSHSSWHHHDDWYYRKTKLQTSGESSVHWDNITNTPSNYPPSSHSHNDLYYTQTQLDDGQLDSRYFTEDEIQTNYYTKSELDDGSLDGRYYTETEVDDIFTDYYTKNQLSGGQLDSRYYKESEIDDKLSNKANLIHNHDSVYYTKTQLSPSAAQDNNVLDARYFTEDEISTNHYTKNEVDGLVSSASYGISGAVDQHSDLPTDPETGTIYIVREEDSTNKEGFYRWDGTDWIWLAHNVGGIYHNDLLGLNENNYKHLTSTQFNQLTTGADTTLHKHDGRYYTESEIDTLLDEKSNTGHTHDDRYYTESEVDNFMLNYYTKDDLDPEVSSGDNILDSRYFTEDEIQTNYYTKSELDNGSLDGRYHTQTEIATMFSNYYDKVDLDPEALLDENVLDARYFTEDEISDKLSLYFTKNELQSGSLDTRYFTETELQNGSLDERYYTETEIDNTLGNYYTQTELEEGSLDGRYYTEDETDSLLNDKSDTGHTHDDSYYTETELSTDSIAEVHWSNLTNIPTEFNPSEHDHDDKYYTKTELNDGQLDDRYYTETEIDAMVESAAYGISGSVDYKTDLPTTADDGEIYIVNAETDPENEGFYRWNGTEWVYLAPNTGATSHNNLDNLNSGDYLHLTSTEYNALTGESNTTIHTHDSRYYTESEIDNQMSAKSDIGHIHDDRYYTETEIDGFLEDHYTKGELDDGSLDGRYFTETEITTNYYSKTDLNNGQLNNLYYTENELDNFLSNKSDVDHIHDNRYYTETETNSLLDEKSDTDHTHDGRYYTETETDNLLGGKADTSHSHDDLYFTKTELDTSVAVGENVLDDRYYTETEIQNKYYSQTQFTNGALDSRYYTESEVDTLLDNKAETNHNHDNLYYTKDTLDSTFDSYYTKVNLEDGALDSRYFTENEIKTNYYSKNDLNNGSLDSRYYTESEVDSLISGIEAYGIKGGVDYYEDLPTSPTEGDVYIVRYSDETNEEGFYKWEDPDWIFLANNTGATAHNNLSGLNTDNYLHLTSTEYSALTNGSDTTLHTHDDRYYKESEIDSLLNDKSDTGHTHDDLYYTETEIDTLLNDKSDTNHDHDGRYYTETEIDDFLSNYYTKDDLDPNATDTGDNVLDARYFTESEIQTNYYTKSDLDDGQLDNRYYKESEIDSLLNDKSDTGHTHDDRYYTETEMDDFLSNKSDTGHDHDDRYYKESEIDTLLDGKSDTGHKHDDRYYTEIEMNSASGAGFVGISSINGISSGNVQGALEELATDVGNTTSNLQEAYESGNTISTDDTNGPVKMSGDTTPPLELSNQTTVPTQNINGGSLAVINNELYIYDGGREKWLTPSKILTWGDKVADGGVMTVDEVGSLDSGYNLNKHGTIIGISLMNKDTVEGKDVNIMINGTTTKTVTTDSEGKINNNSLNIDFDQGDVVNIYVTSTGAALKECIVTLEICWRA